MTVLSAVFCFAGGLALGGVFFGGLWLTTLRVASARRPGLLLASSCLVRMIVAVLGFYVLLLQGPGCLLAGLFGFIVARLLLVRRSLEGSRPEGDGGNGEKEGREWS